MSPRDPFSCFRGPKELNFIQNLEALYLNFIRLINDYNSVAKMMLMIIYAYDINVLYYVKCLERGISGNTLSKYCFYAPEK